MFEDYFTICSQNRNKRACSEPMAEYKAVKYTYKKNEYEANYQVRFDEKRNCIQVIFQQTAGKSDWRANFDFPSKIYDQFTFDGKIIQIRAHGGWSAMWLAMQDVVRAEILVLRTEHPTAYIEVFGWSLGSGVAQLAAEDIYFKFGVKPYLYTYGSVKPFFGRSTYKYVKNCCEQVYNFKFKEDIVGYMVPFLGWRAINSIKLKAEPHFCIKNLFNPQKYHTIYDLVEKDFYKDIK